MPEVVNALSHSPGAILPSIVGGAILRAVNSPMGNRGFWAANAAEAATRTNSAEERSQQFIGAHSIEVVTEPGSNISARGRRIKARSLARKSLAERGVPV